MLKLLPKYGQAKYLLTTLITLMAFLQNAQSQQPNLLINGDFSMDSLYGYSSIYYSYQLTGWNCTTYCEIMDCYNINQELSAQGQYNANCTGFIIDLIANDPQNVTQNVVLEYDYYNLSFNYYYPRANANTKTMEVYFNQVKTFDCTPNVSFLYEPQYFEKRVQGIEGVNSLRLTTKINSGGDPFGFYVNNIRLTKMTSQLKELLNQTLLSDFASLMAKIPGSRVIFIDFMSYFVNFDRMQLYYFHNRNYSQYSTVLLANINILNDFKGLLFRNVLEHINPRIAYQIDSYFSSIDYKYDYTPDTIFERDEGGRGFVSNCYQFFFYNIPGTIITYLVFLGLFKLVKNRPASRLIRKFSFFGLVIPMVFEGNIEWLTYYSIGEMTLFFSADFRHRLINIFITVFQFIITIVAVGSILFFKYHYRRLIFYFIEDKRNNGLGVLCQTVDNGIICMLFGIAHQILFSRPQLQLFVLLFLECAWTVFKACLVFRKAYKKQFSQFIMLNSGFLRMCFIVTFYFYGFAGELRTLINDAYHKGLIIVMILLWLQELLVSLLQLALSIPRFLTRLGLLERKGKSSNLKTQGRRPLQDALKRIEKRIKDNLTKAKQDSKSSDLFYQHKKKSHTQCRIKGKVFEHQRVRIAHLRVRRLLSEGQSNRRRN